MIAKEICLLILVWGICSTIILASTKEKKITLKPDIATFDRHKAVKSKSLSGQVGAQGLVGGISLDRVLPAVPKNLHQGVVFKEANLPKQVMKSGDWYKIPDWLAGKWHREKTTKIKADGTTNTHTDRIDHIWGHQSDRFGNAWHYRNEPYVVWGETDNYDFCKTINLQKPVFVSQSKIIILYKDITVRYTKNTHTITKTEQHEELAETVKRGDLLIEEIWGKWYDENGKFTYSDHGTATYTRISSFQPTDVDKKTGLDLKKDFAVYLTTHKLSDHVPTVSSAKLRKIHSNNNK